MEAAVNGAICKNGAAGIGRAGGILIFLEVLPKQVSLFLSGALIGITILT